MARPSRRRLPFLHRNWTAGITAAQNWRADKSRVPPGDDLFEGDADGRPSKRRRVGPLPPGIDGGSADGSVKKASSSNCAALWLPDYPASRCNGLRIQVFNLFHEDSPRLRFASSSLASRSATTGDLPPGTASFSARCKITIMSEKCGMPVLLYCASQIGTIETCQMPNGLRGPVRLLFEPFTIPLDNIAILHEDTGFFGLADKYKLRIAIESTGNETWPPMDLLVPHDHRHNHPSRYRVKKSDDCVLYAESSDFFTARPHKRIPLWLRESLQHDPIRTAFVMDMDVRWSTGFLDHPRRRLEKGVLPTIVAMHPDEPCPPPMVRLVKGLLTGTASQRYLERTSYLANKKTNGLANGGSLANGTTNGIHKINGIHKMANGHINGDTNDMNGVHDSLSTNGHHSAAAANGPESGAEDDDEEADGQLTPSRSLRSRREQPDYNLRNITNKAHGKGSRKRRQQGRLAEDLYGAAANGFMRGIYSLEPPAVVGKVTYLLPPEKVTVNGFVCCMCFAANPDMNQLRAHLQSHIHYRFDEMKHTTGDPDHHTITMTHCPDWSVASSKASMRPKVFQLGRPTKPLDLDKYLAGDSSWVTSRFGSQHDDVGVAPVLSAPRAPKPKVIVRGKTLVVPHIKQPLYDPLSKARLEAGAVIRPTVVDDDWLVHKHREVVQDYSDLSASEKDFIQEWDRFIIPRRISSDAYMPRAVYDFIDEKGMWLVADQARSIEFGKHLAVLVARGILPHDQFDLQEVAERLNVARQHAKENPQLTVAAEAAAVPKTGPHRSKGGCTKCGLPVFGPRMLICANKACARRLYHSTCIKDEAKIPVKAREWYCNECAHLAKSGTH